MEELRRLVEEYNLPSDALKYLDSISFQETEAGIPQENITRDLTTIAAISSRYGNDIVGALRLLDRSMEAYLKKNKSPERQYCGSLEGLAHEELRSARENRFMPLSLISLQHRISDHWISSPHRAVRKPANLPRYHYDTDPYLIVEEKPQAPVKPQKKEPAKPKSKWDILFGDVA